MGWVDAITRCGRIGLDTFGQPVTFTRGTEGPSTTITGIVDEPGGRVQLLAGAMIQTDEPSVAIRIADLDYLPEQSDTVAIAGRSYRVLETRAYSEGHARVFLHRLGTVPPAPRPISEAAA